MRRLVLSLATAATATALLGAAPRPLELADLRKIVSYGGVAIAPDGRHVAAIERTSDFTENRSRTHLVLIDVRTHALRDLTPDREGVNGAAWSPNGDRIAFVSAAGEKKTPQVWVLPVDGGEAMKATDAERGVDAFAWRPDGRALAYVTADEAVNKKAIDAHDDAFDVTNEPWTARAAATPSHIWTLELRAGAKPHRVTSGAWSVVGGSGLSWRADGKAIAFTRAPDGTFDTAFRTNAAIADVADGKVALIGASGSGGAAFDRAGTALAYTQPNARAAVQNDIVLAASDGSRAVNLSARLDRNAGGIDFLPDGALLTVAVDGTRARAFALRRDAAPRALALGDRSVGAVSTARDGTIAFTAATATDASEIYVLPRGARAPQQLTTTNAWLATRALGTKRTIAWRSPDGVPLDAVLTEPPGFTKAKKYPLVLVIHGGPTSATRATFNGLAALMAARGWLVLEPNYRGSDNHGAHAIETSLGHPLSVAGRDIIAVVDQLSAEGFVDTSRIGISGWSAGGMMTSWLITHDTRWKAAFDGAAVVTLLGVQTMSDVDAYGDALMKGNPWADDALMKATLEESPLTYADRVRTPTLIVTDAGDQRVPTPLSYEFYHAVRATGTPVELLVYPVNGHFPSDPLHAEDVNRRWVEWFAKHF